MRHNDHESDENTRVRQLVSLWNWLPAFRVVAETSHLPTASAQMGVTAPALSRTIKLLEEELGQPLFRRVGRRLELNDAGKTFLLVVRDAMRGVDEGLNRLRSTTCTGPIRISAPSPHAWILVRPAIRELRQRHPELVPHLDSIEARAINEYLCGGSLDVAIMENPLPDHALLIEQLAEMSYGVYCGSGHHLFESCPDMNDVLDEPFIAWSDELREHWPPTSERRIGMRVNDFFEVVELCATGEYLAVLPDAVASSYRGEGTLWRLPLDIISPAAVFVVYRRPVGEHRSIEAFLASLRDRVARGGPGLRLPSTGGASAA